MKHFYKLSKELTMIKKYGMYIFLVTLFIVASVLIYEKINPKELPANLISATGKIDGDLTMLNTKYPGRLEMVAVQSGQKVQKGAIIAKLTSQEYQKKLLAVEDSIAAAKKSLEALRHQRRLTNKSVTLSMQKAYKAIAIARDEKAELLNAVDAQAALVLQDEKDFNRTKSLYAKKLIAQHKLELAHLKLTADTNKLQALQHKLLSAKKAVAIAQDNYKLARAQKERVAILQENIEAAADKIKAMQAKKGELEVVIHDLTLTSPIDGYVVEKVANKGEVLGAGMVVATLIDPQSLYLKVFVDTMKNGKIKIGDDAVIFLDAYPDRAIPAKVVSIAANAEFTPKEVAVRSDRIQRVFAVHLKPTKVDPLLKLGIPAVGVISTDGKGLPHSYNDIPSI